jgi:hypothetical protein
MRRRRAAVPIEPWSPILCHNCPLRARDRNARGLSGLKKRPNSDLRLARARDFRDNSHAAAPFPSISATSFRLRARRSLSADALAANFACTVGLTCQ